MGHGPEGLCQVCGQWKVQGQRKEMTVDEGREGRLEGQTKEAIAGGGGGRRREGRRKKERDRNRI